MTKGRVVLLLLAVCFSGCSKPVVRPDPVVEFTTVPPAAQGGRERVGNIAGRVSGARPGQQIVVYARSGPWWVQPFPDKPFIPIKADSTWSTPTHLGFEYAALLVDSGYHPPSTMDTAPVRGGSIVAVNSVKGVGEVQIAPTKPLKWSGYDWTVRTISGTRGGLNNLYSADNAWTDKQGALHLLMKKQSGRWSCAELELTRSLGYGTYIWVARDITHLEPAAVMSLHTFDDWGGDEHFRELDVEMSRWGDPANKNNAQYGVQPFYIPGNLAPFTMPSGTLTNVLHWESGRASFKTFRGSSSRPGSPLVYEHIFTTGVPSPGQEKVQLMLYVIEAHKYPLQKQSEVVLEKFEYLP